MLSGRFFSKRHEYDRALQCFQDALLLRPDDLLALAWVGHSCMSLSHYQDAIAAFDRALQIKPDFEWCHAELGKIYCFQKKGQHSIDSFNRAFRIQPGYTRRVPYLIAAASAHGQIGDDETSRQLYSDAVCLEPQNAEAQYGLGWTLQHMERYQEAEGPFRRAVELNLKDTDAHYNFGLCLFELKLFRESEQQLRRAVELEPTRPQSHYALGCVLSHQEKYADATRCYEEVLKPVSAARGRSS